VAEGAFCGEHGVLEAVCTKCNPALVPVFKAKGDWCEAHGFPESFCPLCRPERYGRPANAVAGDEAPADGTKVRFKSRDVARLAGIEVARAVERPGGSEVAWPAKLVYDSARWAEVDSRVPGVVREVRVDIGTAVRPGTPLALIESAELGADQSRAKAARSRVELAETDYSRLRQLHEEGIGAEKDALAARQELDAARAELSAAESALAMIGSVAEGAPHYTVSAPIAGVVTERHASVGRMVHPDEVLFEIVDTSRMWAEVQIPETELSRVGVGRTVTLAVQGIDRELEGVLSYVAPEIDPQTRSAAGRLSFANPDGALRANMFATARIAAGGPSSVVVPRAAVQQARGAQLVFVRMAEDLFEARRIQPGWADDQVIEVRGRVAPGDEVVTTGSFLLKTETLKESIGAGCCEVEGPD
jgi:cobalt-zinc-cadmium efflux system membrane fusion protein